MNKIFLSILLVFFVNGVWAQNSHKGFSKEQYEKDLEEFIIKEAGLTPKKVAHFFPLYNEMKKKQRDIHNKIKKLKKVKPSSDVECKKNILAQDKLNIEMMQLQKVYHYKFMKVLSPSKLYDVIKAEDKFHRQAYRRAAKKANNKNQKTL